MSEMILYEMSARNKEANTTVIYVGQSPGEDHESFCLFSNLRAPSASFLALKLGKSRLILTTFRLFNNPVFTVLLINIIAETTSTVPEFKIYETHL